MSNFDGSTNKVREHHHLLWPSTCPQHRPSRRTRLRCRKRVDIHVRKGGKSGKTVAPKRHFISSFGGLLVNIYKQPYMSTHTYIHSYIDNVTVI